MPPRTSKDDVTRSVRTSKDDVRANRASKDDVRKPFHLKDDVKKKRHDLIAKRNTKREEEAAFIFNKFDTDKSGSLDEAALHRCFTDLGFSNGRQNRTDEDTKEWVRKELKRGDKKGTGRLGYDDFVEYYNRYVVGHRRQFEHTFELGQQIGQGAFGAVYRAKRVGGVPGGVAAGELVAVKQVEKDRSDEVALELLHNEITIWEQLQHVNLVRLLDVFETDTTLSLVTELCRGGDLFERLAKVSAFSELAASRLARQIVGAVGHLHEHGVVHCDLKPSNILVMEREEVADGALTVKIADFGLSQSLRGADGSGKERLLTDVCGTPDYFAPELVALAQRLGEPAGSSEATGDEAEGGGGYGPPLDCWAVGCILFELLAGRPPYQANDEQVLYYKISDNHMEFPSAAFGGVSPSAKELILSLTKTAPEARLSCAEAMRHPWLRDEADIAGGALSSKPLSSGLSKARRQSMEIRSALQLQQQPARAPRPSQPTAAFDELEHMRTVQEVAEAEALQALMKKMDDDDAAEEAAAAAGSAATATAA